MASSTSNPIASTIPNIVNVLMVKPTADKIANVPRITTGTAIVGMIVAPEILQKQIHDQED